MKNVNIKKLLILNLPYFLIGLFVTKLGQAYRLAAGSGFSDKLLNIMGGFAEAFQSPLPSVHPSDLLIGLCCGAALRLAVYIKSKNAKKFRKNTEYYRENSRMVKPDLNATAMERVKGMVELRDCVHHLIDLQMWESDPLEIRQEQQRLNDLYDAFSAKFGLINDRGNRLAFSDDSSYYLLCSLEVLDEDGKLERKADMFTKRTIKQHAAVSAI